MTFSHYQAEAIKTALPSARSVTYMALGLAGEAGEIANKVKKLIRDGDSAEKRAAIADEIGDVLWYAAGLATELGVSLEDLGAANLTKLNKRMAEGKIQGSGDKR